jgi:hypothetical protein
MSKPYSVAHLAEIPEFSDPDGDDIGYAFHMVRRHLGIRAFGINAMVADRAGATVVVEHSELEEGVRHEEVYYVARGHATFEVDGERIDAPEGTFVHVPDPASKRAAAAEAAGTVIVAVGGEPGVAFAPSAWEDAWAGA